MYHYKDMRILVQRVKKAKLYVEDIKKGEINQGLVLFVGFKKGDKIENFEFFKKKILNLRVFEDEKNKMNYSVLDLKGELMIIPQFTLYGDCSKSNRPDFTMAEKSEIAKILFEKFVEMFENIELKTIIGEFGKKMIVEIYNDGPCTIMLEK